VATPDPRASRRAPSSGRARPLHAVGPIAGCIFTVLAWAAIAHNSGSGWVQALGVMLGSVLLVGLIAPGRIVNKAQVSLESSPMDAVVDDPVEVSIVSSTRVRVRPVEPSGKVGFFGPVGARSKDPAGSAVDLLSYRSGTQDNAKMRINPDHRGIVTEITVDIASAAPFGLLWWTRRQTLPLPVELCVAPKPTKALLIPPEGDGSGDDSGSQRTAQFGETRGVRDYEHGDARRTVHWRASAHTGHLMVREMEMPTKEPVIVRVVLPSESVAADEMAGRALATVIGLVERSRPVMLATHEPDGDRVALVTGLVDAGRRLARAVASGQGPGSVTIDESARREENRSR
jgi:uncharacterized protein (DUF58 family)